MQSDNALPLTGIRVLDLTQFLSGPFGTQILGDLGAEIIKLEGPEGDLARHIPPHFVAEDSVYFLSINRNKKSVVLDLKTDEGRSIARRLALASDIVVENFRPGVLDRLGLSARELRAEKPSLIWCSISGFGQTGPYRDKPAYDMIVQALSGGMSLTGDPDGLSVRAGIPIGDIAAGMYGAVGILAALNRRTATGRGEYVDISMLDCQAAMLSYQAAYYLHSGKVPGRQGRGHDSIATYRSFRAGDGIDLVVTANTERMWAGLCKALGLEELVKDPRFLTNRERYANRHVLWPVLEQAFLSRTADEWVFILERESVPVGVVNTLDRVIADTQIKHRGMIVEVSADDGRSMRVMGNPISLEETGGIRNRYPPAPGEHTIESLRSILKLSSEEIDRLLASRAIIDRKATTTDDALTSNA